MSRRVARWRGARRSWTRKALLAGASAAHRAAVAETLGCSGSSLAETIATDLADSDRTHRLVDKLSSDARALLLRSSFEPASLALELTELDLDRFGRRTRTAKISAARELERHGLAFAFLNDLQLLYYVPRELHQHLRPPLVAQCARSIRSAGASHWLALPRQDLVDIAALWEQVVRDPIPITGNGEIYERSLPRLLAALPELELPDDDGKLRRRRLDLALAQLRDSGNLELHPERFVHYPSRFMLVATGDLGHALAKGTPFRAPPEDPDFSYIGPTVCARMLAEGLAGRSVGLRSLGLALRRLTNLLPLFARHSVPPRQLAFQGIFPAWLRGEVQLGMRGGQPFAVRFEPPEGLGDAERLQAARWRELRRAAAAINGRGTPQAEAADDVEEPDWLYGRLRKWRAEETHKRDEAWREPLQTPDLWQLERGVQISTIATRPGPELFEPAWERMRARIAEHERQCALAPS